MIKTSENINELASALCELQGELSHVSKDTKAFGYNYTELYKIYEAIREPMRRNGLSVTQLVGGDSGCVSITTMLLHKSGQYISDVITAEALVSRPATEKNSRMSSIQAAGSTISYLRRYSLLSIIGIASGAEAGSMSEKLNSGDDDGEGSRLIDNTKDVLIANLRKSIKSFEVPVTEVQGWLQKVGVSRLDQLNIKHLEDCLNFIRTSYAKVSEESL